MSLHIEESCTSVPVPGTCVTVFLIWNKNFWACLPAFGPPKAKFKLPVSAGTVMRTFFYHDGIYWQSLMWISMQPATKTQTDCTQSLKISDPACFDSPGAILSTNACPPVAVVQDARAHEGWEVLRHSASQQPQHQPLRCHVDIVDAPILLTTFAARQSSTSTCSATCAENCRCILLP